MSKIHGILVESNGTRRLLSSHSDHIQQDIAAILGKPVTVALIGLPYEFWGKEGCVNASFSGECLGQKKNRTLEALTDLRWHGPGVILKGDGYASMQEEARRFVMGG